MIVTALLNADFIKKVWLFDFQSFIVQTSSELAWHKHLSVIFALAGHERAVDVIELIWECLRLPT